jgi:murein DD-endopeptidase MepM/ murein hydrolase activator NlpD
MGAIEATSAIDPLKSPSGAAAARSGRQMAQDGRFDAAMDAVRARAPHTVRAGDTLWALCRDCLARDGRAASPQAVHRAVGRVARANGIADPDRIYAGQRIDLSAATSAAESVRAASTASASAASPASATSASARPVASAPAESAVPVASAPAESAVPVAVPREEAGVSAPGPFASTAAPDALAVYRRGPSVVDGEGASLAARPDGWQAKALVADMAEPPRRPAGAHALATPSAGAGPVAAMKAAAALDRMPAALATEALPAGDPVGGAPAAEALEALRRLDDDPPAVSGAPWQALLGATGRLTSDYGMRNDPFTGRRQHHDGIDIAAPAGTDIFPHRAGVVAFSGWKPGYGKMVVVRHADGSESVYGHTMANHVRPGQAVDPETPIAQVGSTGRSTGPHLHFEVRRDGVAVNPMDALRGELTQLASAR